MHEDKIIEKLIEIDAKIDGLVTQKEFSEFKESVTTSLDAQTVILKRLDVESITATHRIDRIERRINA